MVYKWVWLCYGNGTTDSVFSVVQCCGVADVPWVWFGSVQAHRTDYGCQLNNYFTLYQSI